MAKRVGGRDSALDPAEGAYDAPPDTLVGWEGTPLPRPHTAQRLRRFDSSAFGTSNFGVPIVVNLRNDHCTDH